MWSRSVRSDGGDGIHGGGGAGASGDVEPRVIPLLAPEGVCPSCDRRRALLTAGKKRYRERKARGGEAGERE